MAAESRVDKLEERLDRVEKKVGDGFARADESFARVDVRLDEVYAGMGRGFAEHRRLLSDHIDRRIEGLRLDMKQDLTREVGAVRAEMGDGFAAVNARLDTQTVETGTRFDRLETKLDAFIDAQSAVNRKLLEYLDR